MTDGSPRMRRLPLDRTMTALAAALLVLLLLRAALTFDPYYDSVAYHLPFAARLAGLCPESCYLMSGYMEAAYDGFPKLFHRLQGLVWRITGHAQAVDLLNVGAIALFCLFLRRWFRVPAAWSFCALIAVPLVQIHATSTYTDLPVNLAAAAAILALVALLREPEAFGWPKLAVLLGCLAFAANSKPQMVGMVAPVGALFAAAAFAMLASGRRVGPFAPDRASGWLGLSCLLAAAAAIAAAKLIDNAIAHGNPFYPIRLAILGLEFDGPMEGSRIGPDSLAAAWQPVPSPLRWLASVLEVGAYAYRPLPWTYDQGYCGDMLAWRDCGGPVGYGWWAVGSSFRMGGYFVGYVLALLAFLGWALATRPQRLRRILGGAFIGTTLLVALLPRSHELRYYLFWMIVLVSLCLITVFERSPAADEQDVPTDRRHVRNAGVPAGQARLLGAVVLVALSAVLLLTQARYVSPVGATLGSTVDALGIGPVVARIPDGAVVCTGGASWQPFNFLFAPVFHPDRRYGLRDRPLEPACSATLPDKDR